MKYLKQFLIILLISFAGELLKYVLPLPIPASIYGMVILLVGLLTGWIALDAVKDVGKFLIEIPAGVGLMSSWGILKPLILPVSIITVVTIVTVMAATGKVSQWVIRKGKSDKEENEKDE